MLEPVDPIDSPIPAATVADWGGLAAYTAVYAPAGLQQGIEHVWWKRRPAHLAYRPLSRAGRPQGRLPHLLAQDRSEGAVRGSLPRRRDDRLGPAHRAPPLHRHALSYHEAGDAALRHPRPPAFPRLRGRSRRRAGAGARGRGARHGDDRNGPGDQPARWWSWPERLPNVWATVGIHPHDAGKRWRPTSPRWRSWPARKPRWSAFGEMGLDFFRNLSPPEAQREVFRRQIAMARRAGQAAGHPLPRRSR